MTDKPTFVYLASPYSDPDPKVVQARRDAVFAAVRRLRTHETIIFSPIVASHPYALVDGPGSWETWAVEDRHALLSRDELWVYMIPGWIGSKGITAELEIAREAGKHVRCIEPTDEELAILRDVGVGGPPDDNASVCKWRLLGSVCANPKQDVTAIDCGACTFAPNLASECGRYEPQAEATADETDGVIHYESGASRSSDAEGTRYDLIAPVGLRRLAERYAMGAKTHGDRNWEKGVPDGVVMNHLLAHLNLYREGDRSEDHLAAVAWGVFALMHASEKARDA